MRTINIPFNQPCMTGQQGCCIAQGSLCADMGALIFNDRGLVERAVVARAKETHRNPFFRGVLRRLHPDRSRFIRFAERCVFLPPPAAQSARRSDDQQLRDGRDKWARLAMWRRLQEYRAEFIQSIGTALQ